MKKTKSFREAIAKPLRKKFTSAVAQNVKPRPTPEQYAHLTRICKTNVGIRQSRSKVGSAGLSLLSLAEGMAGELIITKKVKSLSAVEQLVRESARAARGYADDERWELLNHCLDYFGIDIQGDIEDFPNRAA